MVPFKRSKKSGGRRRNYEPAARGARKFVPVGWANWVGTVLFSAIFVAMVAEVAASAGADRGADIIASAVFGLLAATMAYLFATSPRQD